MTMYRLFGKRLFDLLWATAFVVVLSPVWITVSVVVLLNEGPPVFFRQPRVGKCGDMFEMIKFRSMPVGSAEMASADAAEIQITRLGAFIRRTSIDELPQLVNILRGDMSVVGPRPALPSQADLLGARRERKVLDVVPGLTGLAQINSFDGMGPEEKVDWEAKYVSRMTLTLDLSIIFRTVGYLFRPPPIY
jgi:O-antigen biosynthesis protein WbqP